MTKALPRWQCGHVRTKENSAHSGFNPYTGEKRFRCRRCHLLAMQVRRAAAKRNGTKNRSLMPQRGALKPRASSRGELLTKINHGRMKPKAGAPPDAEERRHLTRVAHGPCVACGSWNDIVLHHVMKCPGKIRRRDHRFVARLCAACHNMGDKSVHLLGSEAAFEAVHGVDLAAWAIREWEISCGGVA